MRRTTAIGALGLAVLTAGCGSGKEEAEGSKAAVANEIAATATAAPAKPAVVGFDPSTAPIANPMLDGFPYFGLMDGYVPLTRDNSDGGPSLASVRDAGFDRYEFFDGHKLIPVEGRLKTVKAMGTGASFFQAEKNYEVLVKAAGGVTVYEGNGKPMKDAGLTFEDGRHRGNYKIEDDRMGVYMIRTPTSQIWVEVYKAWESEDESYWLTVVETKPLDVTASLIPAAQLKSALDAAGHVAIPVLFDNDAATLRPESSAVIAEAIELMTSNPDLRLAVEGHTDNNGTPAHNQVLSAARAKAVVAAMIAGGIAPGRLVPRGFGQDRPVADNGTEDGRAKNRRVELVKL